MADKIVRDEVRSLAAAFVPEILRVRRHMHRYPELSFEEKETAAFLSDELSKAGIEHATGMGGYGIRALIHGRAKPEAQSAPAGTAAGSATDIAKVVALRADFDALPILEQTGLEFASLKPGVMHACGHDAHSSILLHAAKSLHALRDKFSGTIVCLFQPAEEKIPGGAQMMIKAGALSDPKPHVVIGEHIHPGLPAGTVGFRSGTFMASADDVDIRIVGKGGHGAQPHLAIDPITVAAQVIGALQQVVSRMANPAVPSVLTFGRIVGNGATNVIPDTVEIAGTFRTMNEEWRHEALRRIKKCAEDVAAGLGARAEVDIELGYPVVDNDPELTERIKKAARDFVGGEKVVDLPLIMWGEDFAYYSAVAPSSFYNIGVGNTAKGWTSPLHSPTLMIDEDALEQAVGLMTWLALAELDAV